MSEYALRRYESAGLPVMMAAQAIRAGARSLVFGGRRLPEPVAQAAPQKSAGMRT